MVIYILGRGPSLNDMTGTPDLTIGCSTVIKADVHYLIDRLHQYASFSINGKSELAWAYINCKKVYSYDVMFNLKLREHNIDTVTVSYPHKEIATNRYAVYRGLLSDWKEKASNLTFCVSHVGAFPATILAWKLGAKKIVYWGVDMGEDYYLPDSKELMDIRAAVMEHFTELVDAMNKEGVELYVGNNKSILSELIPIYNNV